MTRLADVNTTDVLGAIELAMNAMCSIFDPNGDDVPYFRVAVRPEAYFGIPLESHVPGRHLNALLNAEDAAGLTVDEACVEKFANACFYSYSGPLPFPLDRRYCCVSVFTHSAPHSFLTPYHPRSRRLSRLHSRHVTPTPRNDSGYDTMLSLRTPHNASASHG